MPIIIPRELPASDALKKENIFVMNKERADHQDIRPLKILILNLMPKKIETETQLIRLLGNTPIQIQITLLKTGSYESKNTSREHLKSFYKTFDEVKESYFDGLIITGAPVEDRAFESVDYWDELTEIMLYAKLHVTSTLHICWGAQAGLYYHYGINKHDVGHKVFGVYDSEKLSDTNPLLRGFDDIYRVPHSRHTETKMEDILNHPELDLLSYSQEAGVTLVASKDLKNIFATGHSEYDGDTLNSEYKRDLDKGLDIKVPEHYYKDNDPTMGIIVSWKGHGHLLFSNWINYCVYQKTPFEL